MDTKQQIKFLSDAVARQGEALQALAVENAVLQAALTALVASHPNHAAFAQALRQSWLRLGEPNQAYADDPIAADHIGQVLTCLEEACSVPLNIRPPGGH